MFCCISLHWVQRLLREFLRQVGWFAWDLQKKQQFRAKTSLSRVDTPPNQATGRLLDIFLACWRVAIAQGNGTIWNHWPSTVVAAAEVSLVIGCIGRIHISIVAVSPR